MTTPNRTLKADEYRNDSDGLVYCINCHTPRQVQVQMPDRIITAEIRCRCLQDMYDAKEAEYQRRQRIEQISRMRTIGLQDRNLRTYTFANDNGCNPEIAKAHAYVDHWSEMKAKSIGLLLWGDVGTGKSFIAGCIANALFDQGIPVLMTSFPRLLNELSGFHIDDKNTYIDDLNRYSLLILDDLGTERSTEYALEQMFNIIDSRYRSNLPLIVTTNLTLNELKAPESFAHKRIYDRILERCVPLKINNQNIRQLIAAENMREAKQLLNDTEERRKL